MKRFLYMCALSSVLASMTLVAGNMSLAVREYNSSYHYYSKELSNVINSYVDEGNQNVLDSMLKRMQLKSSKSQAFNFAGSEKDIDSILKKLNVTIVDYQSLDTLNLIYGFSPKLTNKVKVGPNDVNIQIAKRSDGLIIVGTPLIVGSY